MYRKYTLLISYRSTSFPKTGATQMSLFERSAPYGFDACAADNLELE